MDKEDVLKAFAGLSPEDQAAVRERLGADPWTLFRAWMQRMGATGDPAAICREMATKVDKKGCCGN